MIPIGTRVRVGQDISFPRQSVFPGDTTFSAGKRGRFRPGPGRPFGVPGAQVVEPELGDIGDTIGGGTEVLGPDQEPGFPGGARATFIPPPPFPEAPPTVAPSGLDRALRIGGLAIGGAKQVASLIRAAQPTNEDLGNLDNIVGGATQVPGAAPPQFDLAGDLEASFNPPPGGGTQVPEFGLGDLGDVQDGTVPNPEFDIAADLESSFNPTTAAGTEGGGTGLDGFGLGDAGAALNAGAGLASTILSDRPDWEKAVSSVQAGSFAAPAIAGAIGGQAAAGVAGTVAGGVGLALSLAQLGATLSKGNDSNATEAQRIAADREKAKAVASTTASLVSLGGIVLAGGPAGGAVGAVLSIGLAIDSLARMLDAQGKQPPEGQNWTDYKSIMIGKALADRFPETFSRATNPLQLLGLALSGPSLAPHGEMQIMHDTWGSAGDFYTPTSATLSEKVSEIAATGNPDLLREFIQGVHIKTGGTGSTKDNWYLTDLYRRQLVSMLPTNHPVRLEAEAGSSNLFEPATPEYTSAGQIEEMIGRLSNESKQVAAPEIALVLANLQAGKEPRYGQPINPKTVSPFFRQPGELDLTPEQRAYYIDRLSSLLPAPPASAARVFNPAEGNYTLTDQVPDKLTYWLDPTMYMADDYYSQGGFNLGSMSGG